VRSKPSGNSPKGKVNCRGIDIREIGENGSKSTSALEVVKPRGRPGAVDPNKRSRPLILFTVERFSETSHRESGVRGIRTHIHLDIRNPKIPIRYMTAVI
jgi:hypothetical protein